MCSFDAAYLHVFPAPEVVNFDTMGVAEILQTVRDDAEQYRMCRTIHNGMVKAYELQKESLEQ